MPFWEFTKTGKCNNGETDYATKGQKDCQKSCMAKSTCIGISYFDNEGLSDCLICYNETLEQSLDYVYYKRPGNHFLFDR